MSTRPITSPRTPVTPVVSENLIDVEGLGLEVTDPSLRCACPREPNALTSA